MMARSTALQSKAGYIDARPLTANSSKSSCYARPDHTLGSNPDSFFRTRMVLLVPGEDIYCKSLRQAGCDPRFRKRREYCQIEPYCLSEAAHRKSRLQRYHLLGCHLCVIDTPEADQRRCQ